MQRFAGNKNKSDLATIASVFRNDKKLRSTSGKNTPLFIRDVYQWLKAALRTLLRRALPEYPLKEASSLDVCVLTNMIFFPQ